jgi:hypothetical protein
MMKQDIVTPKIFRIYFVIEARYFFKTKRKEICNIYVHFFLRKKIEEILKICYFSMFMDIHFVIEAIFFFNKKKEICNTDVLFYKKK